MSKESHVHVQRSPMLYAESQFNYNTGMRGNVGNFWREMTNEQFYEKIDKNGQLSDFSGFSSR